MLRKNNRTQRGAWRINTAQAIIILIALGCGYVVYNAYQKSGEDPLPAIAPITPPDHDPRHARYAGEIAKWQQKLSPQQMTVTWPFNNLDNVVRIDLPDKIPITLVTWDEDSEKKVAIQAYYDFVRVRARSHIPNPTSCIVHVFAVSTAQGVPEGTMEEVVEASASGVSTSADQALGGG